MREFDIAGLVFGDTGEGGKVSAAGGCGGGDGVDAGLPGRG